MPGVNSCEKKAVSRARGEHGEIEIQRDGILWKHPRAQLSF